MHLLLAIGIVAENKARVTTTCSTVCTVWENAVIKVSRDLKEEGLTLNMQVIISFFFCCGYITVFDKSLDCLLWVFIIKLLNFFPKRPIKISIQLSHTY